VARVTQRDPNATIAYWVEAFKKKRPWLRPPGAFIASSRNSLVSGAIFDPSPGGARN
jgi:hypothetical protein